MGLGLGGLGFGTGLDNIKCLIISSLFPFPFCKSKADEGMKAERDVVN